MHATRIGDRAVEHPVGQWRNGQRFAGVNVLPDPGGHLLPAGLLPQLERTLLGAEAPAHGEIDVACAFGNALEMHSGIVELVAQDGPEEARFCTLGFAQ